MNMQQLQTPTFPQVVLWEHVAPLFVEVDNLKRELAAMKRLQSQWVGTKEALQITGIKSGDTLKRLRELPDSPITSRLEGIMPKYCRASLVAYCESKILKPSRPGRNLAA